MHGKQKRFHAPFFVGKRRFMEQTEKQTMEKEQCPHIKKKSEEPPTTWQFISAKRAGKP